MSSDMQVRRLAGELLEIFRARRPNQYAVYSLVIELCGFKTSPIGDAFARPLKSEIMQDERVQEYFVLEVAVPNRNPFRLYFVRERCGPGPESYENYTKLLMEGDQHRFCEHRTDEPVLNEGGIEEWEHPPQIIITPDETLDALAQYLFDCFSNQTHSQQTSPTSSLGTEEREALLLQQLKPVQRKKVFCGRIWKEHKEQQEGNGIPTHAIKRHDCFDKAVAHGWPADDKEKFIDYCTAGIRPAEKWTPWVLGDVGEKIPLEKFLK